MNGIGHGANHKNGDCPRNFQSYCEDLSTPVKRRKESMSERRKAAHKRK